MSNTTVYAAEILNTIAERRNLEQFTGTSIFIHGEVGDELVGWLGGPLPSSGYPCEHMGMDDVGDTACWSSTEINRLREENAKLRELAENLLMGFVYLETEEEQQKCIDRALDLRRELDVLPMEEFDAHELGIEVDE